MIKTCVISKGAINIIDLSTPLFSKEGLGEILQSVIKIILFPPLRKGDWEGKFLKAMTLGSNNYAAATIKKRRKR
jgi:hypothetical protein